MNKNELEIKLKLLEEIESRMFSYMIGDLGLRGVFTEMQLRVMKKDIEKKLNNICDFCIECCNNEWCVAKRKENEY